MAHVPLTLFADQELELRTSPVREMSPSS